MAREVTGSTQVVLPVPVEQAWAVLSDTPRMVALDPLIDSYEPENGAVEEGTLNRVRSRIGPFPARLVTRTEVVDAPHRVVFESVSPSRPVRIRSEETLAALEDGCCIRVRISVTPNLPLVGPLFARLVIRTMLTQRRRLLERLRLEVSDG